MVMVLGWVVPLLLILALGLWGLAYMRRRPPRQGDVLVANSGYLETLPAYQRYMARSRLLRSSLAVSLVLGILAASFLSGRLAKEQVHSPEIANRDIVLCLDVSGSMITYDREITQKFADMVQNFNGERIALSIFNSTSRTVFPLTDDYGLIERELRKASEIFEFDYMGYYLGSKDYDQETVAEFQDYLAGTQGLRDQASLIPDGLASCNHLFDSEEDRSRSIIFVTDNEVNGEPIYEMSEATELTRENDIQLFSLYPGPYDCSERCKRDLQQSTEEAGGKFFENSYPDAYSSIIDEIQRQQAQEMGAAPRVVVSDLPLGAYVFALIGVIGLVVFAWRLDT